MRRQFVSSLRCSSLALARAKLCQSSMLPLLRYQSAAAALRADRILQDHDQTLWGALKSSLKSSKKSASSNLRTPAKSTKKTAGKSANLRTPAKSTKKTAGKSAKNSARKSLQNSRESEDDVLGLTQMLDYEEMFGSLSRGQPDPRELLDEAPDAEEQPELSLPTKDDIPAMPGQLLIDPLEVLCQRLNITARRGSSVLQCGYERSKVRGLTKVKAQVQLNLLGHDPIEVVGDGRSEGEARKAAGLRLVHELHQKALVEMLWPSLDKWQGGRSRGGASSDSDSSLNDVYNYCAKHLALPTISMGPYGTNLGLGSGRKQPWICEIKMVEHDIHVKAIAMDKDNIDKIAALKFKAKAEEYLLKSGSTSPLRVRDMTGLSVENAPLFHDWLRMNDPKYVVKLEAIQVGDGGRRIAKYRMLINTEGEDWEPLGPTVEARSKKVCEELTLLGAAITKAKQDPSLVPKFVEALKAGNGAILRKVSPIDLPVLEDSIDLMGRTLGLARKRGLDRINTQLESVSEADWGHRLSRPPLSEAQKTVLSQALADMYQRYLDSDTLAPMRKIKADLPMNQYKEQVYELVQGNVYSIIVGATGSGKTTQVPQIILEQSYKSGTGAACEIMCTQPRRIAATSVATRVGEEMGPELKAHVGHHVRFDARPPRQGGSLTYCTTGILLQQLQAEPDRVFDNISHLIIDEVHERDRVIDFTLAILKSAVASRLARGLKVPRVVLMSATLDTELFANYFRNEGPDNTTVPAPILSVPGRTFPVMERYLEDVLADLKARYTSRELGVMQDKHTQDYIRAEQKLASESGFTAAALGAVASRQESVIDWKTKQSLTDNELGAGSPEDALVPLGLIAATIAHVAETTSHGAILVFFPGLEEMQKVDRLLRTGSVLGVNLCDPDKYRMYMLHSTIPEAQKTVFDPVPEGVRKIILSTNIGETSITIPEVQHVIDTGKARETQYDHVKRISALQTTWISKSNAKQRAGRAGRVQNGFYLALYSRARHQAMRAIGLPELLRSDLQTTCLTIKGTIRGVAIRDFLAAAIEPPSPASVDEAVKNLIGLSALTSGEELTALGRLLSSLPIHPAMGKMIVLGVLFKCLDPILCIGAAAEERGLFIMAPAVKYESARIKKDFARGSDSDHIAGYNAFSAIRERYQPGRDYSAREFAFSKHMHFGAWKSIYGAAQQMEQILTEHGLVPRGNSLSSSGLFGGDELNKHAHKVHVIKAIMLAGLLPNIGVGRGGRAWRISDCPTAMLPSGSVISTSGSRTVGRPSQASLVTYSNVVKGTDGKSIFLRDATAVNPIALALFANTLQQEGAIMTALGWLPMYVVCKKYGAARSIVAFRDALDKVQMGAFQALAKKQALHDDDLRELMAENVVKLLDWETGGIASEKTEWRPREERNSPRGAGSLERPSFRARDADEYSPRTSYSPVRERDSMERRSKDQADNYPTPPSPGRRGGYEGRRSGTAEAEDGSRRSPYTSARDNGHDGRPTAWAGAPPRPSSYPPSSGRGYEGRSPRASADGSYDSSSHSPARGRGYEGRSPRASADGYREPSSYSPVRGRGYEVRNPRVSADGYHEPSSYSPARGRGYEGRSPRASADGYSNSSSSSPARGRSYEGRDNEGTYKGRG